MARKKLTAREEETIRRDAERASREGADLAYVGGVARGPGPTAVLSVRVPLALLQALREIAARDRVTLSEVVQTAIATYARTGGSPFSTSSSRFVITTPARSLSYGGTIEPKWNGPPESSPVTGGSVLPLPAAR